MCDAGAFRGSPASTTITERRWRPSWRAVPSPAAEPPITATSQCRSMLRDAWSVMGSTIVLLAGSATDLAIFARRGRAAVSQTNEVEEVVRTRLRSLRNTLGLSLDELAS